MYKKTHYIPTGNIKQVDYLIPGTATQLPQNITMLGTDYNGYISINTEDIPSTLTKAIELLDSHLGHELTDDDYYYFTPDLICQILMLASTDQALWDQTRSTIANMLESYEQSYWTDEDTLTIFSLYFLDTITKANSLLNAFNSELDNYYE
jgi:hypothetical protein